MNDNFLVETLLDRPIAFHRAFVSITKSVTAALFLSQSVYWSKRTNDEDGWFYKTQADWEEETGLVRREQESARKVLKELNILEEKRIDVPAKLYYKINISFLEEHLKSLEFRLSQTDNLECHKPTNKIVTNRQTISENTALKEKNNKKRNTEIQVDFKLSNHLREWADDKFSKKKIPLPELEFQTEQFVDNAISKKLTYIDWDAAWRTWIRNSVKWNKVDYDNVEITGIKNVEPIKPVPSIKKEKWWEKPQEPKADDIAW